MSCMHAKSLHSCLTLWDPMDCSLPGFFAYGILQAVILEWADMPSPGDLPNPVIAPVSLTSPALVGGFFIAEPPGKPVYVLRHMKRDTESCIMRTQSMQLNLGKCHSVRTCYVLEISICHMAQRIIVCHPGRTLFLQSPAAIQSVKSVASIWSLTASMDFFFNKCQRI